MSGIGWFSAAEREGHLSGKATIQQLALRSFVDECVRDPAIFEPETDICLYERIEFSLIEHPFLLA